VRSRERPPDLQSAKTSAAQIPGSRPAVSHTVFFTFLAANRFEYGQKLTGT